jgi:hypothetical protein
MLVKTLLKRKRKNMFGEFERPGSVILHRNGTLLERSINLIESKKSPNLKIKNRKACYNLPSRKPDCCEAVPYFCKEE